MNREINHYLFVEMKKEKKERKEKTSRMPSKISD
jgi:hypothetical protein